MAAEPGLVLRPEPQVPVSSQALRRQERLELGRMQRQPQLRPAHKQRRRNDEHAQQDQDLGPQAQTISLMK
jgi:hypothetical protein